jgi:ketosteroid isomerase-like protein
MQNDEQEIRQLVATWMSATKGGDVKAILELMTDDVVFLVAGQPRYLANPPSLRRPKRKQAMAGLSSLARATSKRSRYSKNGRLCGPG